MLVNLLVNVYPILHLRYTRARLGRLGPRVLRRRSQSVIALAWALGATLLAGSAAASPGFPVTAAPALEHAQPTADHRLATALGLGGTYVALGTWMWFAWYADKPRLEAWHYGGDGWFGRDTYAGGADKLGHVWSNLAMSRLGIELLRKGGWGPWSSSLISASLCLSAFLFVEVNDGYYTEFSPGDMTANVLGAAAAIAMSGWPVLDDAFDFRMQWFPSTAFRRHPGPDIAEDYSGQTYLLAFKPRSITPVRESRGIVRFLQFINPVLGFESRNYKPVPEHPAEAPRRQSVLFGLTIDLQAVLDATLAGGSSGAARWAHATGHALTEVFNLPFSTLSLVSLSRVARSR